MLHTRIYISTKACEKEAVTGLAFIRSNRSLDTRLLSVASLLGAERLRQSFDVPRKSFPCITIELAFFILEENLVKFQ
jgi:hypothetical protein